MRRAFTYLLLAAIGIVAATSSGSFGASSSAVVTMNLLTATQINTMACATGTAATTIGVVLPSTSASTSMPCAIQFGSSNGTAALLVTQRDGAGSALYRRSDGSPDPNFGTAGLITQSPVGYSPALDVEFDSQGRLLLAGGRDQSSTSSAGFVTRYSTNGTIDGSFGVGGTRTAGSGGTTDWGFYDIAVGPDQNIFGVGYHQSDSQFRVVRIDANGALVPTFGSGGTASISCGLYCYASAVDVGADGLPIVVGVDSYSGNGTNNASGNARVIKLRANGTLDPAFATGGIATIDPGPRRESATSVIHDDAGRIYIGGFRAMTATDMDAFVARLDANGQLDTTWGSGGVATIPLDIVDDPANTNYEGSLQLAIAADGQIVLATAEGDADSTSATGRYAVVKLDSVGAPLSGFGVGGFAFFQPVAGNIYRGGASIAVDDTGGILVSGQQENDVILLRLTATGVLDGTFGTGGYVTLSAAASTGSGWIDGLALGRDGTIAIVTSPEVAGDLKPGAMRLGGPAIADFAATTNDWDSATNTFGACLLSVGGGAVSDGSTWPTTGSCPLTGSSPWRGIPSTIGSSARIAGTPAIGGVGTANLIFGTRSGPSQRPGTYVAPIVFTVVAPFI